MDNPDPNGAASPVIRILRRLTRFVQVTPFVYLLFYGVYMVFGSLVPDNYLGMADTLVGTTPITTTALLFASRLLKLCRWHKVACLIPSASQIEGCVDTFVFQFTEVEITLINVSLGIVAIIFLISAYRHFFVNGR